MVVFPDMAAGGGGPGVGCGRVPVKGGGGGRAKGGDFVLRGGGGSGVRGEPGHRYAV